MGFFAYLLLAFLAAEIVITLFDFVEEDRIRRLPLGERVMHSVIGIVYGAFLAYLVPELWVWRTEPAGFGTAYHGFPGWVLTLVACGVLLSGIRDLAASFRKRPETVGSV